MTRSTYTFCQGDRGAVPIACVLIAPMVVAAPQRVKMTPEEFTSWSERLRASVRGTSQAKEDESYATAKEIARKALNLQLTDRTGGALYFHQRNATPGWAAKYTKTAEIGEFVFYKPRGGEAR